MASPLDSALESVKATITNNAQNALTSLFGAGSVNAPYNEPTPTAAAPGAPSSAPPVNSPGPASAVNWGMIALAGLGLMAVIFIAKKV